MNLHVNSIPQPLSSFSDRIKMLIQRVGSVTEIARMCGFSEGVVRSWRDGNTDPSRARCVTLARTLGISLIWLVAGEGSMQIDSTGLNHADGSVSGSMAQRQRVLRHGNGAASVPSSTMDPKRLNTALRMLQSELDLADSQLTIAENSDMLAELYEILGPGGDDVDAAAMVAFNQRLAERLKGRRSMGRLSS